MKTLMLIFCTGLILLNIHVFGQHQIVSRNGETEEM